jgi:hypothetical protein
VFGPDVDELDVQTIDLGHELRQRLSETPAAERLLSESIGLAIRHPAEEPVLWSLMATVAQQLGRIPVLMKVAVDVAEPASRITAIMGILKGLSAKEPALLSDVLHVLKSCAGAMPVFYQLVDVALEFRESAHPELALSALQDACLAARNHRTMATFQVLILERGAPLFADIDRGALLLRIFHDTVHTVSWWRT